MKKIFVSLVTALYLTVSTGVAPLLAATIVIDPGHGGYDGGAAYYGLKEKELNLEISKRLKALLEADNHEVIMTRDDDTYLTLQQRVDIINGADAQFYVAVHNNANTNTAISGTQTYYYDINDPKANPSKYPPSQAAKDNSALNKEAARLLQQGMLAEMGTMDRGYLAGNLYVNRLANVPGALVEVAFISSTKDSENLKDPAFLEKAAQGIKAGIDNFLSQNPSEDTVSFTDIGSSWARSDIKILAENGIIKGENGKFYPSRQITRAELAALLVRALESQIQLPGTQDQNVDLAFQPVEPETTVTQAVYGDEEAEAGIFTDVSPEFWGYKDIMTAQKYGLVGGYKDKTFKPQNIVTRAEVSAMIARYLDIVAKLSPKYAAIEASKTVTSEGIKVEPAYNEGGAASESYQVGFADVSAHWAKAEIVRLATLGIVGGYEDGTFKPKASATRAEIAALIKRAMEHTGGLN